MNFGFSMFFFLRFGLGGAGVQIVETCIFLRGTVMKASSHEKDWKQQWKKTKKKKQKVQTHGQGLGRGLAGDMGLNFLCFFCFFGFSMVFSDPWARSGLFTHKPKNQKTKKTKNQETKKPKNQKNKKPKKQKKQKKQDCTPQGEGSDAECWVLSFWFFCFFWFFDFLVFWFFGFLVFWFFGFLVCVWRAMADVPSRDCQALSVVALEARSIHYSTAMFAMT